MINAGEYTARISINRVTEEEDAHGFKVKNESVVFQPWAKVKTTRGFTLIANHTDFEKAFTNFTIRFPKTEITRDMVIRYKGKKYSIEYLNNINEANVELEIQAKEAEK